ncbi:MAG TPA: hypothetical protein ENH82_17550 [bacterium]|nr:hypothetical protein [bacterium]
MKLNKPILLKSFFVSFLYVGFGTFSLIAMSPLSPVYWEWSSLGLLITMPVSFLGFGIMFMERNYLLLFLIQTGVFLIFWLIVYRIWVKKARKKSIGRKE